MYLLVIDYYSRDVEIMLVPNNITVTVTIARMKKIFSLHDIPDIDMTDRGPHFVAADFTPFARDWGFERVTYLPSTLSPIMKWNVQCRP